MNIPDFTERLADAILEGYEVFFIPYDYNFLSNFQANISGLQFNVPDGSWSELYAAISALLITGLGWFIYRSSNAADVPATGSYVAPINFAHNYLNSRNVCVVPVGHSILEDHLIDIDVPAPFGTYADALLKNY